MFLVKELKLPYKILLIALITIYLAPVFYFEVLSTQDGPMHVYTGKVMKELLFSENSNTNQFFQYQNRIHTNIFIQHFLMCLQIYIDPIISEKVFQALYVLLFFCATFFCLKSINSNNTYLIILILPFIYNYLFFMGFYNFVFSIIPLLFGIGVFYKINSNDKTQYANHGSLALCLVWAFASHMTSFTVLLGVLITLKIGAHFNETLQALLKREAFKSMFLNFITVKNVLFWTICLAHILFVLDFLKLYAGGEGFYQPKSELLNNLIKLDSLVAFGNSAESFWTEKLFYIFAALTIYLLIIKLVRRNFCTNDFLLVCAGGLTLSYFSLPLYGIGSGMITTRAMLYPFLLLVLWFASHTYKLKEKLIIGSLCLCVALNILWQQFIVLQKVDPLLTEFLTAKKLIHENEVIYPLILDGNGYDQDYLSNKTGFFVNASLYLSSYMPGNINLANAAANERFSTIMWDSEIYPLGHGIIMQMPGTVPDLGVDKFKKETDIAIDKIFVWGTSPNTPFYHNSKQIALQIEQQCELVWQSEAQRMSVYSCSKK